MTEERFYHALRGLFYLFILASVGGGAYCLANVIMASDKVEYCEINSYDSGKTYSLEGRKQWRSNQRLGYYPTIESAKSAASQLNCEIPMNVK